MQRVRAGAAWRAECGGSRGKCGGSGRGKAEASGGEKGGAEQEKGRKGRGGGQETLVGVAGEKGMFQKNTLGLEPPG